MTDVIEIGYPDLEIIYANDGNSVDIVEAGNAIVNLVGSVSDGNKGDITVSINGTVWRLNSDTVNLAKTSTASYPAAIAVSALRLVRLDSNNNLVVADKDIDATLLGLTIQSAIADAFPTVILSGLYSDSSWNWTRGSPLYLGTNGNISALVPSSGFIVPIGRAENPTTVNINVSQGVQISGN